ncbi:MAG: hypothetical protein ACI9LO_003314, partial [Planctomycetota bacterium]
ADVVDQRLVELLAPALLGNIFCWFSLLHPLKKWSLRQTRGDSVLSGVNTTQHKTGL